MGDRVSPAALKAAFGTLRGYLDDLARSSFDQHATKLRLFVNYFQRDDTVRYLADRLHTRLADVLEAAQKPEPRLPDDARDRLAFVYGVLYHLKQGHKLEVRELLSRAFPGSSLEAKWDEFRRRWLSVLAEGFGDLATKVEAQLGSEPVDPAPLFANVLDARAPEPAPTAHAAPAPAKPPAADAAGMPIPTLRDAVAKLPESERGDLPIELEILALEKTKKRPVAKRLEEIVASFESVSDELGALARHEAGLPAKKRAAPKKAATANKPAGKPKK